MNIRFIKHLELRALAVTLWRFRDEIASGPVYLREAGEDGKIVDAPRLSDEKWKPAKNTLARVRRAISDDIARVAPGKALGETVACVINQVAPETEVPWLKYEDPARQSFILTLETNPGATFYIAGGPPVHMEVGGLWWFNARALHSFLNAGDKPVVYMICDFTVEEGA